MSPQDKYAQLSKSELIERLHALEAALDIPANFALLQELAVHQEEVRAQNDQLLEMQRHLELSRSHYEDLYEFAPVAFASFDTHGVIRQVNITGAHLLGMEREALLGRPFGAFVHRDDLHRFLEHLGLCRRQKEVVVDLRLQLRDGRCVPAHLTTRALRVPGDRGGLLFRTAITDLSEHQRVEEERREALLREGAARASSDTKDQLIAMVSHELRTPLSAVLLWAKILQIKLASQPETAHALEVIVRSAEAQRQLIDDLLDVSRISSGKLRLQLREVSLGPLIATTVESVLPTARAKGISIETDIAPGIDIARVDPDRLRQVIWNLLNNSVKFTPPGGLVRLSAQRLGEDLDLRVTDNGQGIDAELLPHIFEPFRQAETSVTTRAHGGLGLGLAICKQLVEQHAGTIHVVSDGIGRGATFVVRLPLGPVREPSAPAPARLSESAQSTDATALAGLQVLLVDDEAATRSALETFLGAAGARLIAVSDAQTAIDAFQRERPDVIVGDIGMPGYQMMQRVRDLELSSGNRPTPAIALTAFASSNDRERARAAGYDIHMAKPVEPADLVMAVRRLARPEPPSGSRPTAASASS